MRSDRDSSPRGGHWLLIAGTILVSLLLIRTALVPLSPTSHAQEECGATIDSVVHSGNLSGVDLGVPEGGLLLVSGTGFSPTGDNRVVFEYLSGGRSEQATLDPLFCTDSGGGDVLLVVAPIGIDPDTGPLGKADMEVSVLADGKPACNRVAVRYVPAGEPALSGISPEAGSAGTLVTLQGSGLGSFGLQPAVTFAGIPTTHPALSNGGTIAALVPEGLPDGPVEVVVAVPGHDPVASPVPFDHHAHPVPQILLVAPGEGTPGSVTSIEGTNLAAGAPPGLGIGEGDAVLLAWSPVLLLGVIPRGLPSGEQPVVVTVDGIASTVTGEAHLTVVEPGAPRIDTVRTPQGEAGAPPGHAIVLEGAWLGNLTYPPRVLLDGVEASSVSGGEEQLVAQIPSGAPSGPADVTVVVEREGIAASTTLPDAFTIDAFPPPVIAAVLPQEGAPPGGEVLVLGGDFGGTETVVKIGFTVVEGVAKGTIVERTHASIRAVLPADAAGGPVYVRVGRSEVAVKEYYPVLDSPEPRLDPEASDASGSPGTSVMLAGSGLYVEGSTPVVSFIGPTRTVAASAPVRSDSSLLVTVPNDAEAGTGTVSVTVAGVESNAIPFEVIPGE